MAGKQVTRRDFSPDFKRDIVREILTGQKKVSEIAKERQIYPSTIFGWRKTYGTEVQKELSGSNGSTTDGIQERTPANGARHRPALSSAPVKAHELERKIRYERIESLVTMLNAEFNDLKNLELGQ